MSSGTLSSRAGRSVGWLVVNRSRITNAVVRASSSAARSLLRHLWTIARQIGLQISGVVFLFFGLGFGYHGIREWHKVTLHTGNNGLATFELALALLFTYFGISSFARALQTRQ